MPRDLTGRVFGRLTVIGPVGQPVHVTGPYAKSRSFWACRCQCGQEKVACHRNLLQGHTLSCGCLHAELNGEQAQDAALANWAKRITPEERAAPALKAWDTRRAQGTVKNRPPAQTTEQRRANAAKAWAGRRARYGPTGMPGS
jgi:hypothetical protein